MIFPQNIVIVEDEKITQRYLQDIFAQYDVRVSGCFDNAADTTEALKSIACDMILMDIDIKGPVDGIRLAKDILKTYRFPVVFITAHNDDETFQEVLELSPYGFIEKPFSRKDIVFTLQLAYKRYLSHEKETKVKPEKKPREYLILNEHYAYLLYTNIRSNWGYSYFLEAILRGAALTPALAWHALASHRERESLSERTFLFLLSFGIDTLEFCHIFQSYVRTVNDERVFVIGFFSAGAKVI